jgi:superfamily II DNA or RNA helicase
MIKPRFVVGPPGTGKTHMFLLEKYRESVKKYDLDKIVLISHTNVAVNQILDAVWNSLKLKKQGVKENFLKAEFALSITTVKQN